MKNKIQLMLMISAIERGMKNKNREKVRDSIMTFLKMPELKIGKKDGLFLDENGNPINIKEFEKEDTEKLIKDFREGLKEIKEYIQNG